MIKKITLENFKRVSNFNSELSQINILVGTNNAGKSSVLQGIHFTILMEVARRLNGKSVVAQNEMLYNPTTNNSLLRHGEAYSVSSGNVSKLKMINDADEECEITLRKGRGFGNIGVNASASNNSFRQQINNPDSLFVAYTPGLSGIATTEQLVGKAVLRNAAARGDANLYLHNILYYISEAKNIKLLNDYVKLIFPECRIKVDFNQDKDIYIKVYVEDGDNTLPLNLCGTGFLQIIQIIAYSIYFKPSLLLLDEPDEHLHPENQHLLCEVIKSISENMNMQIILSTHSRHILSSLKDEANLIWMKNGKNSDQPISETLYEVLVDLGALDSYDAILQGKYKYVILTEDAGKKYLKKLLEFNGYNLSEINIISYNSCSNLESAKSLAEYLLTAAPKCKFLIHRDRDFMTDHEVEFLKRKFSNPNIKLWITDECDIEAYFTTTEHISNLTGKSKDEVDSWINNILSTNTVEIQASFFNKREEVKRLLYANNALKGSAGNEEDKFPSALGLFGTSVPTSRKNIIGKYLFKKCRTQIKEISDNEIDLITYTDALQVQSLKDAMA